MIVRTRTGSEYHIEGSSLVLVRPGQAPRRFTLISLGERRVRYTDGELLYTSSEVVARLA